MDEAKQAFIQHLLDEMDDYAQGVVALHAFASSCCWDDSAKRRKEGSRYCIPRRMSSTIDEAACKPLTPDGVIQVSAEYGVVAEMKKHFPSTNVAQPFRQAQKYAAPLLGWWTKSKRIAKHDVVLLTDLSSTTDAQDAYLEWTKAGNSIGAPFAIVEFGYVRQGQEWFHLRRMMGSLSDRDHDQQLRKGKRLSPHQMTKVFEAAKLMETEPPLLHLLILVYTYALTLEVSEHDFELSGSGAVPVAKASVASVCKHLQQQFRSQAHDDRSFTLPKTAWVRKAMDALVRFELGTRPASGSDVYRIALRRPSRKDFALFFAEKIWQEERKVRTRRESEQPSFFDR